MAGDLTEQTLRAEKWLVNQKWKLRSHRDYRPRSDLQITERFLSAVPRELLRGLVQYLQGVATEENPLIEGSPYFGTWIFSRHIWERDQSPDDNTLIFVQTMVVGTGLTAGFIVEKGCAYQVTQTFYWDVETIPTVLDSTSGVAYSLAAISFDKETGLYRAVLEKRERKVITTGAFTSARDSSATETTQKWKGVRTGNLDENGAAVVVDTMTLEVGKVKKQDIRKNDDCTTDIDQVIELAVDQPITEWEKNHSETAETAKATQGIAETEPGAPADGVIVEVLQDYTSHGKARKSVRTRTAVDQPATDWEKTHAETTVTAKATQGTVETIPNNPAAGTIVEVVQDLTPFGKTRKAVRTRTAIDQTAANYVKSHAETVSEAKHTQGADVAEPGAPDAGVIVEVDQEPTPHGKARTLVRTRTAVDQPTTDWEKNHAETAATVKATQGTEETEPGAPSAGTIIEVSQDLTAHGKARKAVRTRTAVDQPITEWDKSHAETIATVKATQGTAETEPGAPSDGTIVEVSQDYTQFGKARKAVRTRTAVDQTMTEWQKAHDETVVTAKATQGTEETVPNDPAAGTIVEVSQDPTPYGKARKSVRTRTAVDQPITQWSKTHAETAVIAKATQGTVSTEPETPAAGTVVEIAQDYTQFGKARKQVATRTAVDQPTTEWEKTHAETVVTVKATQGTEETVPDAPAAGTIVEVTQDLTQFGKARKAVRTRTAVDQEATDYLNSHAETVTEAKHTQGADLADPGTPDAGVILEAVQEPTPHGKKRTVLRTRTAVDQPISEWSKTHAETVATVKATQGTEETEPGAPAAGTIVEVTQDYTPHGKARKQVRTRTAKNQTTSNAESRADQTSATDIATQATAEVTADAVFGKIIRARNRSTEFGKFATEKETITPVNQTATDTETRADQTSAVAKATQAAAEVDATAGVGEDNKVIRARNRPTEFGLYATEREVITPVSQTATNGESRADQTSVTLLATQAAAEVTATAVAGKIVRARNRPTEFGLYATDLETIEPTDQAGQGAEVRADQTSAIVTATQADAAADESAIAGKIVRADSHPTEFGKFKTRKEVITPVNQTATDAETRSDQTSATAKATQADAEVSATRGVGEDNAIIRASNKPTEFGKVATAREVITPVNQTATNGESRADQTSVTLVATQADAEVAATPEVGKVIRATNRPTEFGKVATVKETITPTGQYSSLAFETRIGNKDGTMALHWWNNQAAGYGDALMDAASAVAQKSMSPPRLNEFGLEEGTASVWLPDDISESDVIPLSLQTIPMSFYRVKDIVSGGTIVTRVQLVTFEAYTQYLATLNAAEVALAGLSNIASGQIGSFTTTTGIHMYKMTAKSRPLTFGAWATPPAPA